MSPDGSSSRCWFCHRNASLTKEHLLSEPIAKVFGLDRADTLLANVPEVLSGPDDIDAGRVQPLAHQSVRSACRDCNGGWMRQLEHDAADAFTGWMGGAPLSPSQRDVIWRWLLGRFYVWMHRDAGARRMVDDLMADQAQMIANPNHAKALRDGDLDEAFAGTSVGVASADGPGMFGFGNATTQPAGFGQVATGVLALQLDPVQLWVVYRALRVGSVQMPDGVTLLMQGLFVDHLTKRRGLHVDLDPTQVVVRFNG